MRRLLLPIALACTAWLVPGGAGAQSAYDVMQNGLGVPAQDLTNVTMPMGLNSMLSTMNNQGVITATDPPMGLMYTGDVGNMLTCMDDDMGAWGEAGDTVQIRVDLVPPPGMHSFKFNFYFLSREYPDFVGSDYNDTFTVTQQSSVYNGNIVFDQAGNVIDVNTALFSVTNPALLTGTGFNGCDGDNRGGGTGWLTTISPCVPEEPFVLIFSIGDVYDGIYDSAVFLDGFEWREQEEKDPHPAQPISLRFLSPKVGPTAGGQTTVIYGNEFTSDSRVEFDGIETSAVTLLSSERLQVVTPPHSEGMVNVRVWSDSSGFDDTLSNGYTYSDEDAGTMPPELAEVDPSVGPLEGGIDVTVRGGNFAEATTITFDGVVADCSLNGDATEFECDLPGYGGDEDEAVVLVEATNPSGAEAMPPLTFVYDADAEVPDDDGGGPGADCACRLGGRHTGAPLAGVLALLAVLALRRTRKEV